MVVSDAGAVTHEAIVEQFEPTLGSLSDGVMPKRRRPELIFSRPVISERDIE